MQIHRDPASASALAHDAPDGAHVEGDDVDARDLSALRTTLERAGPLLERLFRPEVEGTAHLVSQGPALVVGNHSGGTLAMIEPLLLAHALHRRLALQELPELLLHEVMWHTPLAHWLAGRGALRASRTNAAHALARGRKVLVYPGGDREAYRSFRNRDHVLFGEHRGYIQLAIENGVPVIPIVTAGMHSSFVALTDGHWLAERVPLARSLRVAVLPLTLGFPFGLVPFLPPPYLPLMGRVRIRVLAPMRFERTGLEAAGDAAYVDACHRHVVSTMERALQDVARARRVSRRSALHARVDRWLDRLEAWSTNGAPTPTR